MLVLASFFRDLELLLILLEIFFLCLIILSSYKIITWFNENKESKNEIETIKEKVIDDDIKLNSTEAHKINFNDLKDLNKDSRAWLTVLNTNVDYPVVQSNNNDFYLNHNFYKYSSSSGWPFLDYRNNLNDKNIIIYAHNRLDGSMFGSLKKLKKSNSTDIYLTTDKDTYVYKVFSVYEVKEEDYYLQTIFKDDEFDKFINTVKDRSIKDYNVDVSNTKQVLTLSTCTIQDDYRLVVHAKR